MPSGHPLWIVVVVAVVDNHSQRPTPTLPFDLYHFSYPCALKMVVSLRLPSPLLLMVLVATVLLSMLPFGSAFSNPYVGTWVESLPSQKSRTLVTTTTTTLRESRDDSDLSEETRILLKHAASARLDRSSTPHNKGRTHQPNDFSMAVHTNEDDEEEEVSPFKAAVQQLLDFNRLFWDYTVNFFYVAISCLILLNFCGYGYSFTADDGFQVLPMNEFIQERQWKQELNRGRPLASLVASSTSVTATESLSEWVDRSSSSSVA